MIREFVLLDAWRLNLSPCRSAGDPSCVVQGPHNMVFSLIVRASTNICLYTCVLLIETIGPIVSLAVMRWICQCCGGMVFD